MKIKNLTKSIVAVILGATVSISAFAMVGCGPSSNSGNGIDTPIETAKVEITADKKEMQAGTDDCVNLSATVTQLTEKTVEWTLSGNGADYVYFDKATSSVRFNGITTPQYDKTVTVTATSTVSAGIKSSVIITIRAVYEEGYVNELSSEMLMSLGNEEITVTGIVEDVVEAIPDDGNPHVNAYDFKVMMSEGAWYGEWNRQGSEDKEVYNYRIGEAVADSDYHTFNQIYVDKDNKSASKPVTDFNSIPAFWEDNHNYNHISYLAPDIQRRWEYNAENDVYLYLSDDSLKPDGDFGEDTYLRTYLAHSLTPMLEGETFDQIILRLDENDGGEKYISQMVARTAVVYYGGDPVGSADGATSLEYTQVTLNFSDVGTTVVPDATPYTVDELDAAEAETLKTALENMGNAHNYTFHAVETTIRKPAADPDDYEFESLTSYAVSNGNSATGTEGLLGKVTEDAILLARTGKYDNSMSGELYWTKYSGYKQIDDHYDYFEYEASEGALVGKRQYDGNLFDKMPEFSFAPEIFELSDSNRKTENGKKVWYHTFTLRESAVTRDVAMQISAHSYATDALGSTFGTLKITVRAPEGGEPYIYSTEYPYNLVSGTYIGVIQTTYSNIGKTELDKDTFDTYIPRDLKTSWSGYNVKYYHPDHSTLSPEVDIDAETLLKQIYGNVQLPSPVSFYKAFGDAISGPFYEYEEKTDPVSGEKTYRDYMSINISLDERDCDENGKITDAQHDAAISKLAEALASDGYTLDPANSGPTSYGDKFTVFVNNKSGIMIKIQNNRTRWFFVDIMPAGMWIFNK